MFLKRIKKDLESLKVKTDNPPKHLHIILDHDIDLVEAEIKSISRLMEVLL